ncbi:thrombospondin type-1 domain-containing protein 7B [Cricetulus griseus]|nr:thrombospondin type-1 domain-containing protein 7B [Cricetulus griseus]
MQDSFPLTVQPCVMPKDCETSEWSPWSPCSKTCRSGSLSPGVRSRSRNVKHIAIGGGQECPELLEKETCIAEAELLQPCPSSRATLNILTVGDKHRREMGLLFIWDPEFSGMFLYQWRHPITIFALSQLMRRNIL